jgi:putative two-component system response regulator
MTTLTEMPVLVVDDNPANVQLLEQVLARAGFTSVVSTCEPAAVPALCEQHDPDLVMLDLHMPGLSGYEVMDAIRDRIEEPSNVPVLVITADATPETRHRALSLGARDFVTKPIDPVEVVLRVRNLLQTRLLQSQLQQRNAFLDEAVRERTVELEQARLESLTVLASVAEFHDDDTHAHTQRVGASAALIARQLELPEPFVAMIRDAAPLHDIGKVGVSRRILLKPGALTEPERTAVKRHVDIGARILQATRSPVLRLAAELARTHHERWDGRGYLEGLAGEEIPLSGRITAVSDVFDALTHERPYKQAWPVERALQEISAQAGRQFDPAVVDAFLAIQPLPAEIRQGGSAA